MIWRIHLQAGDFKPEYREHDPSIKTNRSKKYKKLQAPRRMWTTLPQRAPPMSCFQFAIGFVYTLQDGGGEGAPWYGKLAAIVAVFILVWLGYHAWRNKDDFRITVRRGTVVFHGRLPHGSRGQISEFLLRDLAPTGTIRVIGNWTSGRVLRISVRGNVPPGDCQRVRNFVKLTLKG